MVTEQEAEQIEAMREAISAAFGSKVTFSQATRCLWTIVAEAEEAIAANARRGRTQKLSVPAKGDYIGMAEYEQALAEFLSAALKRA